MTFTVCVRDTNGDGDCRLCVSNPESFCRMTPREAVHLVYEMREDGQEAALDRFLDAYAHELAEKIRAADFGDPYYVGTGQADAADLIDPWVHDDTSNIGCPPGCTSPVCACPGNERC